MGRGDVKTAKGKRFKGSYGNTRPKSKKSNAPIEVEEKVAAKKVAVKKTTTTKKKTATTAKKTTVKKEDK